MTTAGLRRCANHRDTSAGWQCTSCNKTLCGKCTAEDMGLFYCCACEARAVQFTKPRSGISFVTILASALQYPFSRGLVRTVLLALALAVIAKVVAFAGSHQPMPWEPKSVEQLAAGDAETPTVAMATPATIARAKEARQFGSALSALLLVLFAFGAASAKAWGAESRPAARNLVVTVGASFILWGPGLAYLVFVHRAPPDAALVNDWLFWLFTGLALVYLPASLANTVGFAGPSALNPFTVFASMSRIKLRYALTLLLVAGLAALAGAALVSLPLKLEAKVASPFMRSVVVHLVFCALVGIAAELVGALAFISGHVFGWRTEGQYVDPVLEGVRAEGVLKRWAEQREALDARVRQAAEAREGGDGKRIAMAVARKISAALESRDPRAALKLYQDHGEWPADVLKEKDLLGLGMVASKHKQKDLALQFLLPLSAKNSFHAARARLALAQIYVEAGDTQQAVVLYRTLITDFPDTEYSRQADQQIARLMGSS